MTENSDSSWDSVKMILSDYVIRFEVRDDTETYRSYTVSSDMTTRVSASNFVLFDTDKKYKALVFSKFLLKTGQFSTNN